MAYQGPSTFAVFNVVRKTQLFFSYRTNRKIIVEGKDPKKIRRNSFALTKTLGHIGLFVDEYFCRQDVTERAKGVCKFGVVKVGR